VEKPEEIIPAIKRAIRATESGKPALLRSSLPGGGLFHLQVGVTEAAVLLRRWQRSSRIAEVDEPQDELNDNGIAAGRRYPIEGWLASRFPRFGRQPFSFMSLFGVPSWRANYAGLPVFGRRRRWRA